MNGQAYVTISMKLSPASLQYQDTTYILRYIKCFRGKSLLAAQEIRFLSRDYEPALHFGWWLEKKGNVIAFLSQTDF